tara:strand:+ start:375 stop:548 length:174 start_codon:yes stop_codon:yes gene_type:complete
MNFNKAAVSVGTTLGAVSNAAASNLSDSFTDLVPIIVELAVVVVLLTYVLNVVKKLN